MWQPLHDIESSLFKIHSSVTIIWDGMDAVKSDEGLPIFTWTSGIPAMFVCRWKLLSFKRLMDMKRIMNECVGCVNWREEIPQWGHLIAHKERL
jgi:hypothetical protein